MSVSLWLHSYTLNSTISRSFIEDFRILEEKKKVENAAQKTEEAVSKGIKKCQKHNDLGKRIKKGIKKKNKESQNSH